MTRLINDANILIDIIKIDAVASFLALSFELKTTDFVFAGLQPEQQKLLRSKRLHVIEPDIKDINGIEKLLQTGSGLSFEDCSVWYYAKKTGGVVGDR